jgi:hypothetical protein
MQSVRFLGLFLAVFAYVALISGCDSELKNCKLQNEQQSKVTNDPFQNRKEHS